ncbi:hypothetical protein BDV25DRAFT_130108 [Aspergillus avenaceus]|uniref:Uncharacterized protein n=1 Tax=Aspergillus avenaceus TaxID=36643 RepID=A0A5N6TTS3_ASPAV|nr:hypothetical protein BDV25DRAFT_130108 [Aspergillus avenaceus]
MAHVAELSAQFESSSVPRTSAQWKSVLGQVKQMWYGRQYKQCVARAEQLLDKAVGPIDPVHKTYLYLYIACSYEEMGRAAHKYSSTKIPLLRTALDHFASCSTVFPAQVTVFEDSDSDALSPTASLVSSITEFIDKTLQSPDDDPFVSDDESTAVTPDGDNKDKKLMPSPLKIRKSSAELFMPSTDDIQTPKMRLPPPLPIKIIPSSFSSDSDRDSQSARSCASTELTQPSDEPFVPSRLDHVRRFNSTIEYLRADVDKSIASIRALIEDTSRIQHARKMSKALRRSASFWTFSPVKDGPEIASVVPRPETLEQRMDRLRPDAFRTVGLRDPRRGWKGEEYYRHYCNVVLGELYCEW